MGGSYAIRGFYLQTIECLLDLLKDKEWDRFSIEPDLESTKVDIVCYYHNYKKVVQVKSSKNKINKSDIGKWCEELEESIDADKYQLTIFGHDNTNEVLNSEEVRKVGKVVVPRPKPINIGFLKEVCENRLTIYLEHIERFISSPIRLMIINNLIADLLEKSIGKKVVSKNEFRRIIEEMINNIKNQSLIEENLKYKQDNLVILNSFLPSYPKLKGSCLIKFNRNDINGCNITFGHEKILSVLFKGLYTDPKKEIRGFIIYKDDSNEEYCVQLGNNRIFLNHKEIKQLCKVIDNFADSYLKKLKELENKLGIKEFIPNKEGNFRLFKMKISLWNEIIKFSHNHDFEAGNSKWHIFDSTSQGGLKIYTKNENNKFNKGYHAMVYPEQVQNDFYESLRYPNNEVWITWKVLKGYNRENGLVSFNDKKYWTASFTKEWLLNELIPHVYNKLKKEYNKTIINTSLLNKLKDSFSKQENNILPLQKLLNTNKIINYLELDKVNNITSLSEFINELQRFYLLKNENVFLKEKDHKALYYSLELCLLHTSYNDYKYINSNLPFDSDNTLEGLLHSIKDYKKKINSDIVYSSQIDYILRCLSVLLMYSESNINNNEIKKIAEWLRPFAKSFNREKLIDKYKSWE